MEVSVLDFSNGRTKTLIKDAGYGEDIRQRSAGASTASACSATLVIAYWLEPVAA
jgi:hypothetical protein